MLARFMFRFRDRQGVDHAVISTGNTFAAAMFAAQKWAEHSIAGPTDLTASAPVIQ